MIKPCQANHELIFIWGRDDGSDQLRHIDSRMTLALVVPDVYLLRIDVNKIQPLCPLIPDRALSQVRPSLNNSIDLDVTGHAEKPKRTVAQSLTYTSGCPSSTPHAYDRKGCIPEFRMYRCPFRGS